MIDLATDLDYPEPTKAKPLNYLVQSQGRSEPTGYHEEKPPLVIFHSPCLDGFTAAWACWLKHPNAEFVPGVYGQAPPNCEGRDVVLLDFSYKRSIMVNIINTANSVLILDHHKTAKDDLDGLDTVEVDGPIPVRVVFDMDKSGARLAWEWFHPKESVPLFVRLVEDRDLWRFALPHSKELNADFFSYDYDFADWTHLWKAMDDRELYNLHYAAGAAIERAQAKSVKELVAKLQHVREFGACIPAYKVPCANLPYTYASDAANLMAQDAPFAATYYQDDSGQYVFSLRSVEGGMDVSLIAATYGGGGHKHAAGFRVASLEDL